MLKRSNSILSLNDVEEGIYFDSNLDFLKSNKEHKTETTTRESKLSYQKLKDELKLLENQIIQ